MSIKINVQIDELWKQSEYLFIPNVNPNVNQIFNSKIFNSKNVNSKNVNPNINPNINPNTIRISIKISIKISTVEYQ